MARDPGASDAGRAAAAPPAEPGPTPRVTGSHPCSGPRAPAVRPAATDAFVRAPPAPRRGQGGPDGDRHAAAEPAPGRLQDGPAAERGGGEGEDEGAERAHRVLPVRRVLHRRHHHHRVPAHVLQELHREVPADQQVLPHVQHQDPRDTAAAQPQAGPCHAGHRLQAGARPAGEIRPALGGGSSCIKAVLEQRKRKQEHSAHKGEEKRIREFYQSRGLDRVTQPSSEDPVGGDPMGLPYSSFDHSRAHYFRYDEHVSLCLEKQSSSKDKNKAVLQQKYVRCSVRAQIRHLRRVLCHRLGLALQHVQILFNNEILPDHMTMKQLWLSRWFGKPAPLLLHYSIKDKRR